ncbi:sigma-70 family RNA polymerase sigma factor [Niastella caeni]|uniref:Sigma-70 family RNA polymerase sigma factor n=1 Tax=Niastella caeni TaxID=2569763 RepID=A0A4S8HS69_9BACT|nr:sigma-70 family RNA polymerase sigma factor [Niastella caeni]THU38313.1 sigma-70 family RNA polymerase sigma factor [Niastella caeni]
MDESQFVQLIDQHQGIIHKICRLYRDAKEDREDLFQEIVFQLWKSLPTYSGKAGFSTWMYKVALNTALVAFRKKKPAIIYTPTLPDEPVVQQEPGQQEEQLFEALKKLNDGEKALITLYLEELSHKEIADIIGITENNVSVKLNRIKNKIQQLLKK